jgi:hypothetical protein
MSAALQVSNSPTQSPRVRIQTEGNELYYIPQKDSLGYLWTSYHRKPIAIYQQKIKKYYLNCCLYVSVLRNGTLTV